MNQTFSKKEQRMKRKVKISAVIRGTADRPRLAVYRSNRNLTAQLIDDAKGETLGSARVSGKTVAFAKTLGTEIANIAKEKKIQTVIFDRAGFRYHGAIAAIADAAREGGLKF